MGGAADVVRVTIAGALRTGLRIFDRIDPAPERLGRAQRAPLHADPVVLVGGFATDAGFLEVWRRSLVADGYRVFVFDDPAQGLGSVREAGRRLGAFVDAVRGASGAGRVDLVAYSAGGTVSRSWLSLDGGAEAGAIDRLVVVDGSWRGDDDSRFLARLRGLPLVGHALHDGWPRAYFDLQRTSALFGALAQRPELPAGVRVASIFPKSAASLDAVPGARNVQLASEPGHIGIMRRSVEAYEAARALLAD